MAILTIDQILQASDLPRETVPVPEWGGEVVVQGLSRAQFEAIHKAVGDDDQRRERAMLAACIVEPKITEEQAGQLAEKSLVAYSRVAAAVGRVNGTTGGDPVVQAKSPA